MNRTTRTLLAAVAAAGVGVGTFGIAAATSSPATQDQVDDDGSNDADDANEGPDVAITGEALDRASAVALDFTGEGRVTDTEVGDEESYYEVEVTLDDGRETDIQLDEDFNVVGTDD